MLTTKTFFRFVIIIIGLIGLRCQKIYCLSTSDYKKIIACKEKFFPNPAYHNYVQSYFSDDINPYELTALMTLEVREQIKKRLLQNKLFLRADRLIILVISTLLSEVSSIEQTIYEWRSIPQRLERTLDDFTELQKQIITIPDAEIMFFYSVAQECKEELSNSLKETMEQRLNSTHSWHIKHQCDQTATCSVELLKLGSIKMSVKEKYLNVIKQAYYDNPDYPILEQLKNDQIFDIGNFDNSKGAFIVHDMYDHFWFSIKLDEAGIFKKYPRLLLSLGNPHLTDLFSREGELIATISAHFRWFHCAESDYKPLFTLNDIITILEHSKANNTFTENQQRAYEFLKNAQTDSLFVKAVPFILSGMAIQMLKYITINGFPRSLNELYEPSCYFDVFNPEHVAFVIESTKLLFDNYNQSIGVLLHLTKQIESYLVEIAQGISKGLLVINLSDLDKIQNDVTLLTPKKIDWMANNIGFEAVRYPIKI